MICPECKKDVPEEDLHTYETSYEWIETKCKDCWSRIAEENSKKRIKDFIIPNAEVLILNEYGNYTVYGRHPGMRSRSGRPDGRWILGALSPEQLKWYYELGGTLQETK